MNALERSLEDSLSFGAYLYDVLESVNDAKAAREYRDVLLSNVGNILRKNGRKSLVMNGVSAKIVPVTVLRCRCHNGYPEQCKNALVGEEIYIDRVEAERVVVSTVKP
ncbi:MAG: hypothetical protein M3N13_09925 [Candidatus Eremiobacteraeota bacterium]|nr:hypothetical protein [Candidatus Eremiobacteraeota bacterium]